MNPEQIFKVEDKKCSKFGIEFFTLKERIVQEEKIVTLSEQRIVQVEQKLL